MKGVASVDSKSKMEKRNFDILVKKCYTILKQHSDFLKKETFRNGKQVCLVIPAQCNLQV